jgi:hypothetical protein
MKVNHVALNSLSKFVKNVTGSCYCIMHFTVKEKYFIELLSLKPIINNKNLNKVIICQTEIKNKNKVYSFALCIEDSHLGFCSNEILWYSRASHF